MRVLTSHPRLRGGFTLIEVTISVAMALVLMLGIAQVFRISGDAVGTGQALSSAQRDARAAQTQFNKDLNGTVASGSPFMTIFNNQIYAFRNRADMLADKDQNANTADLTGSGAESTLFATQYGVRSHRTDTFNFFSRGYFHRQTGAQVPVAGDTPIAPFVGDVSSPEALVWYGHLKYPNSTGAVPAAGATNPGAGTLATNPLDFFADDWILGRVQTLLIPGSTFNPFGATFATARILDSSGNEQYAYVASNGIPGPLTNGINAFRSSTTSNKMVASGGIGTTSVANNSCRLDLAKTSIGTYCSGFRGYLFGTGNFPFVGPTGTYTGNWYNNFFCTDTNRYWYFPVSNNWQASVTARPITPEIFAYQSPVLVKACTQFIVEYAGDFLNQNATGGVTDTYVHVVGTPGAGTAPTGITSVTPGTTDGVIDYFVGGSALSPTRQVQWYGMPRSTAGKASIKATNGDVVPLRDLWIQAATTPGTQAPFEVKLPVTAVPTAATDYSLLTSINPYTCAWTMLDRLPKMIRITMVLDDPQGRLGDGQTYEYIFTLP